MIFEKALDAAKQWRAVRPEGTVDQNNATDIQVAEEMAKYILRCDCRPIPAAPCASRAVPLNKTEAAAEIENEAANTKLLRELAEAAGELPSEIDARWRLAQGAASRAALDKLLAGQKRQEEMIASITRALESLAGTVEVIVKSKARTWCPICGPRVLIDKQGLCAHCGSRAAGPGAEEALDLLDGE